MMTKNRNVHFQLLILWKNNDKKLVGVECTNKKKKSTSKAKKMELFYCFKLGKVSCVIAYRIKRCLVCRWLRVATKRLGKTHLVTNLLRFHRLPSYFIYHDTVTALGGPLMTSATEVQWIIKYKHKETNNWNVKKKSLKESFTAHAVCFKLGKPCIYFQH